MARTHTFKGSASAGYGYAAFIEDGQFMSQLCAHAPKLANSIDKYYFDEAQKIEAVKEETNITHRFKDSRDFYGYGYYGYIENGLLVLGLETPSGCEIYFRGPYAVALSSYKLGDLRSRDKVLYDDIMQYFSAPYDAEDLKHKLSFDEETKTILFKVKIYNKNGAVHNCLVRGRTQSGIIFRLMKGDPEVHTLQTYSADVFAIRSDDISAVEFVED